MSGSPPRPANGPPAAPAGWFEGPLHVQWARVYYEDTDLSGVVYHAHYLRFFERGRSDFLRLAGVRHNELLERDPPLAFAVTAMQVRFLRPARIDDSLRIETLYRVMRGARLDISQRILRDGALLADAEVSAACIDLQGRPRRPPQTLVDALSGLLAGDGPFPALPA